MRRLQWDTDFWGIDIIHIDNPHDMDLSKIHSESYLVQALANISNLDFINLLESKSFNFIENKITLKKQRNAFYEGDILNFRNIELKDLDRYKFKFYELFGHNSRFNIFDRVKINEFYYTWMVNSVKGLMDDKCIGLFLKDKLAGFVTYRIRNRELKIGLLGVMPNFQGKGISQRLLNYIDNIALLNDIDIVSISTQGRNLKALNAYIKNGYKITSIDHWYYLKGSDLQ